MVDAVVNRSHAIGREAVALEQRVAGVLRDRDDDLRATDRPAIHELPVGELRAAEELRMLFVLQVGHRRRGRRPLDGRQHDAQREVDCVETIELELLPERLRPDRREGHRRDPAGHRPRCAIAIDDGPRKSVGRVGCDRGQEDAVLQRPDARECAAELARVRFRAAADPRDECQQADADHGASLTATANSAVTGSH